RTAASPRADPSGVAAVEPSGYVSGHEARRLGADAVADVGQRLRPELGAHRTLGGQHHRMDFADAGTCPARRRIIGPERAANTDLAALEQGLPALGRVDDLEHAHLAGVTAEPPAAADALGSVDQP